MPKSKKKHQNKAHKDPISENGSKVIKAGLYDGSQSSSDFVVSGHSTGAANTEMEALSHQVSRDAGAVPAYPTDDDYRIQKTSTDIGANFPEDYRDTADLGGPELYGPNPGFLGSNPLNPTSNSSEPSETEYARHGLHRKEKRDEVLSRDISALLQRVGSPEATEAVKGSQKTQTRGKRRMGLWGSVSLAGAALLGFAAYKIYNDEDLRKSLLPAQ